MGWCSFISGESGRPGPRGPPGGGGGGGGYSELGNLMARGGTTGPKGEKGEPGKTTIIQVLFPVLSGKLRTVNDDDPFQNGRGSGSGRSRNTVLRENVVYLKGSKGDPGGGGNGAPSVVDRVRELRGMSGVGTMVFVRELDALVVRHMDQWNVMPVQ